jgi:hypothetical protein
MVFFICLYSFHPTATTLFRNNSFQKFSVNTTGKRALSQKKYSRVESFQHGSHERAVKATGMRYDWMCQRVLLDGVFRTMTERNVNTQCRGCHYGYRRYKPGFCEGSPKRSQWPPARQIIGNGWMKSDCDYTAIQSGAW